ncbi:hypothetical protein [Methylobacterium sp. J-092]|uniref:hypothetical protein n=1 Tax=Methylobacterium sp. J-092 TaxID=2836667 RepID=UPI001FBA1E33|nr:hypothetical protein [Methylobacterium sp. J-092]MCJ2006743.1 hypothetical protein [Methylobacterium sp. J-092]
MQSEDLVAVRDRVRTSWDSRSCGLFQIAATLRIERLIALHASGRIDIYDAMRLALQTEGATLFLPRLPRIP